MKTLIVFFLSLSAVIGYSQTITTSDYNVVTASSISDQKIDTSRLFTNIARLKHEIYKKIKYLKVDFLDSVFKLRITEKADKKVPIPTEVLKRVLTNEEIKRNRYKVYNCTLNLHRIETTVHYNYTR